MLALDLPAAELNEEREPRGHGITGLEVIERTPCTLGDKAVRELLLHTVGGEKLRQLLERGARLDCAKVAQ